MPRRLLLFFACVAIACSACSSGSDSRPNTAATSSAPTTTTTLPPYVSLVAQGVTSQLRFFDTPAETLLPVLTLPNPWFVNDDPKLPVKQVFLVTNHVAGWYQVLLPVRPNGRTGWIKQDTVSVSRDRYRIVVELGAHRITVYDGDSVMLQEPVATGAPATPTPVGDYYLRVLLKAPNPNTVYGPYAYPLSGHSDVLTSFDGGDGELGIHGNNDASVLGTSVTHGCIRMSNAGITRLAQLLPLGTPVHIQP